AAGQEVGAAAQPAVTVQRYRDVDVVEELRQHGRLRRVVARRRQVVGVVVGMAHDVQRGTRSVRGTFGDDVGHLFQAAAVDGQEAEPGLQRDVLGDGGVAD